MAKVRCRRCRKAVKVIHDSYRTCTNCTHELAKIEHDLRLIEDKRIRAQGKFRDAWIG